MIADARLLILRGGHSDHLGEAVTTQRATRHPELTAERIRDFLDAPE